MSLTQSTTNVETAHTIRPARISRLRTLLTTWELYPIILLAAFLRFYQINITEFDDDQAAIFRMAYNGVHQGLIPVMSNGASIGIAHPPGVVFLYMLPALFSPNPLGGALLVAFLTLLAVVLTYVFTRRYYGRFAGTVAALLYGTAAAPVHYARFIWQPNVMPPFTILFMFALFWGVVERRKGWVFLALALLGILYQMHETTLLLIVPLALAVAFSYKTLRWRDLVFSFIALLIIFFPYLLWELFSKFTDIQTILSLSKQHSHIDSQSILFYRLFLVPFTQQPAYPGSLMQLLAPFLSWLVYLMPALAIASIVFAFVCIAVYLYRSGTKKEPTLEEGEATTKVETPFKERWLSFGANRYGGGLVLIAIWQLLPMIVLLRHAIDLHTQYFFVLMPGPFILIGIFASQMVIWSRMFSGLRLARYGIYVLLTFIVVAQLVGTTAQIVDLGNGNFDGRNPQIGTYYNDLTSLREALNEADQQAEQRHFSHVYIAADFVTKSAESYLIEQMPLHTSTTLFDASNCLVLPDPASGPAILLVSPYDTFATTLLTQFASAYVIARPARPGGPPFLLYVVKPFPTQETSEVFTDNLQFVDSQTYSSSSTSTVLATRWTLLRSAPTVPSATYNYDFTLDAGNGLHLLSGCSLTALKTSDQVVAAFRLPKNSMMVAQVTVGAQSSTTHPYDPAYGPFHLEIDSTQSSPSTPLVTTDGGTQLTISS